MKEATEECLGFGPYASKDNRKVIAEKQAKKAMIGIFKLGLTNGEIDTVIRKAFLASCQERARRAEARIAEAAE